MNQQSYDWIFVRDGQRQICWQGCDDWDRLTMLASLSSDPRSIDELEIAWSRYRPDDPLTELAWPAREAPSTREAASADTGWLWIDLENQCYSWSNSDEAAQRPGAYQRDEKEWAPGSPVIWLNVPPWWRELPVDMRHASEHFDSNTQPKIDFRSVLYGRSLLEDIVDRVRAFDWRVTRSRATVKSVEDALDRAFDRRMGIQPDDAISSFELTADEISAELRWQAAIKSIHVQWLMTARVDLAGRSPRDFLHQDRDWKERELDFRRSQWSRERRAPPAVPRTSHMFLRGPMGIEEVVCYFDLCRELILAAWRWMDDDPRILRQALVDELERFKDGWLESEPPDGEGATVREIIDGERSLMPRLSSGEPIDCDCPLCRMNQLEPDLFGPAFSSYDGDRLETEDEFAFSLHVEREQWELARGEWLDWEERSTGAGGDGLKDRARVARSTHELPEVWDSSFVNMSHSSPRLSLLCIGARLSEFISELKRLDADHREIEAVNEAFDNLGRAVGEWLVAEAEHGLSRHQQSTEAATEQMTQTLERIAIDHVELTAKSADLQSLVHQWQRELTFQRDG